MATVNLGRIKPQWQGTYASETSYVVDDMVLYNNSAYICTAASQGNAPTDTSYWDLMTQGSDIPTGGSSGQVLKTDGSDNLSWGDGLPSGGASGQTITTDGSNPSWTSTQWIRCYKPGNQSYSSNVTTRVTFDRAEGSFNSEWNNNGTFTVSSPGVYQISYLVCPTANGTSSNDWSSYLYINDNMRYRQRYDLDATLPTRAWQISHTACYTIALNTNDYVDVRVQNANANVINSYSWFTVVKLGV